MRFAPYKLPSRIQDTGSRERPSTDPMRRREHDPPKPTQRTNIFNVINLTRAKYVSMQATIGRNDIGSNASSRLPGQRLNVVPSKTLPLSIYPHVYHVFKPASASRNSKDPSYHHTSATNYAPQDLQHRATPPSIIANLGHPRYPTRHSTPELNRKGASWRPVPRPRACDYEGYRVRNNEPVPCRCPNEATTPRRQLCDIPEYRRSATHVTHPDAPFKATAVYPHGVIMRKTPSAAFIGTPHLFVALASSTNPDTRRHAAHLPSSEPSHAHATTDPRDDSLA